MNKQQKILFVCSGATLLLAVFLAGTELSVIGAEKYLRENTANLNAKLPEYLEDQTLLAQEPFFQEKLGKKNAGEWFNARVAWLASNEEKLKFHLPEGPSGELVLPKKLGHLVSGETWLEAAKNPAIAKIDLRWMEKLSAYDHWSFEKGGPAPGDSPDMKNLSPWNLPVPSAQTIAPLAKLRLAQGLRDKKMLPALREVRHLAQLLYTTESLVGQFIAVSILKAEAQAFDLAVKEKILSPQSYKPISKDLVARARRALWAAPGFAQAHLPADLLRKVYGGPSLPVGSCAALREGVQVSTLTRQMLESNLFWERKHNESFAVFNETLLSAKKQCRMPNLEHYWKESDLMAQINYDSAPLYYPSSWPTRIGRHVPFLRRAIAYELLYIATPNFMRLYDEPLPSRALSSK